MSSQFRVVLVTGPRQCGKTTLLRRLSGEGRSYVSLDDLNERELAKNDPALFVEAHKPPVLIDEIQYAPEILSYIKMEVDQDDARGAYWLAGSQIFKTMQDVTETLAGRVGIIRMLGLSRSEIEAYDSVPFNTSHERLVTRMQQVPRLGIHDLFQLIHRGTMPELFAYPNTATSDYYSSFLTTYLERDIRTLTQVADEMAFMRFLTAIAARTAEPVVMEDIAREIGTSANTVKRWLSILVTSGLVVLLPAYHKDVLKRAVKMPKLHFLDTGLAAHILKWSSPETLEAGAMAGRFFESWVFSEIYKSFLNAGIEPPLFYYRDKQKNEIDLLIQKEDLLQPIEIKKTASPGHNSVLNFRQLAPLETLQTEHKVQIAEGSVLCMVSRPLPESAENWYIPAWLI
jgi:predicted AAA+ superfamily ATPase